MKKIFISTKDRRIRNYCSDLLFLNDFNEIQVFCCDNELVFRGIVSKHTDGIFLEEKDLALCNDFEGFQEFIRKLAFSNAEPDESVPDSFLPGCSAAIQKLKNQILEAADCTLPVLLTGETGCGKSYAARLIHKLSNRNKSVFFNVNMASINDALVESELFGVAGGAYTDSIERKGYFLSSHGGTLFLDEIGEIRTEVQAKLLYAVDYGKIRQVGSDEEKAVNTRLIFATNADLNKKIAEGKFRSDLYYRIANLEIAIPPLRERMEDIRFLCQDYLRNSGRSLSDSAIRLLETYSWPGNIRQLYSCLDKAMLRSPKKLIGVESIVF